MESIKIADKLTLRQEALRMALERANAEDNIHDAVKLAKEYENFLLGNTELPEFVDPNEDKKTWADLFGKMQENFKPKPMWFPIRRDENGIVDNAMFAILEKNVPFWYYNANTKEAVLVPYKDDLNYERKSISENTEITAYCPIEVPKYEEPLIKL